MRISRLQTEPVYLVPTGEQSTVGGSSASCLKTFSPSDAQSAASGISRSVVLLAGTPARRSAISLRPVIVQVPDSTSAATAILARRPPQGPPVCRPKGQRAPEMSTSSLVEYTAAAIAALHGSWPKTPEAAACAILEACRPLYSDSSTWEAKLAAALEVLAAGAPLPSVDAADAGRSLEARGVKLAAGSPSGSGGLTRVSGASNTADCWDGLVLSGPPIPAACDGASRISGAESGDPPTLPPLGSDDSPRSASCFPSHDNMACPGLQTPVPSTPSIPTLQSSPIEAEHSLQTSSGLRIRPRELISPYVLGELLQAHQVHAPHGVPAVVAWTLHLQAVL